MLINTDLHPADQPIATKRKLQLAPISAPPAAIRSRPANSSRLAPKRCPGMPARQGRKKARQPEKPDQVAKLRVIDRERTDQERRS
jgi:ribosomal protein L19E